MARLIQMIAAKAPVLKASTPSTPVARAKIISANPILFLEDISTTPATSNRHYPVFIRVCAYFFFTLLKQFVALVV